MSSSILTAVQKVYAKYNIKIPAKGKFIPGKHCPGKKPIGKSDECYRTCFGTKGAYSTSGLIPPCEAQNH